MQSQPSEQLIRVGQLELRFFVDGTHTDGHFSMAEMLVPPGARVPPPHSHGDVDETVHVLEGTFTFSVGGTVHELRAGERCFSPRGLVHHFANRHDTPARILTVFSPALIGPQYFRDIGDIINAGGPPDFAKVRSVMERYGLTLAA
ncbi:cupin domain-containing protein [Stigmatella aurantiaca]|uniref:cupin domain-containing protein n=1 Tax=Stigmatella aurantiaca TaxID=41 RepID=UPI000568FE07|nr:cupin domain-containing protein [Stigmatella aurantiaca]